MLAGPAAGAVAPVPDPEDPRIATLRYSPAEPFRLEVPVGSEVTVLLPPGERLATVNLRDPGDWQVTAQGVGDSFTVRPGRPVPDTAMTVLTAVHSYRFDLSAAPAGMVPVVVRITGARRAGAAREPAPPAAVDYRWDLSGKHDLWPVRITDDGAKTYLDWPADQAIPAVFALDRLGREEMVNGNMRGTTFTIDRVYERLVFRIDKASAEARRRIVKAGR